MDSMDEEEEMDLLLVPTDPVEEEVESSPLPWQALGLTEQRALQALHRKGSARTMRHHHLNWLAMPGQKNHETHQAYDAV